MHLTDRSSTEGSATGEARPAIAPTRRAASSPRTPWRRSRSRVPRRIFIGLTEVAGYYSGLRDGFRDLGIPTMFVDEFVGPYGYSEPGLLARSSVALAEARAAASRAQSPLARVGWPLVVGGVRAARLVLKTALLARAAATCDVFVIASGETFFRRRDVALLRRLGKRVVVVFTGSDHRPPYLDGIQVQAMAATGPGPVIAQTMRVARRVADAEKLASVVVGASASAQFHRRPYVEFLVLGIPVAAASDCAGGPAAFRGTGVKILHAPSDPVPKGTLRVRASIQALVARGVAVDYVEITGRPHAEVLAALRDCDFVVDEVFSDAPMAVFAAEAAAFGKPAVVGGYFARMAARVLRLDAIPPTLFCEPEELDTAIERLATDAVFRADLGRRAQEFVLSRWNPRQVAERYLRILDGDTPPEWLAHPGPPWYLRGWGMPEATWREGVRRIVADGGPAALCLTGRPDLEASLLAEISAPV